jgi:hypothetical protein
MGTAEAKKTYRQRAAKVKTDFGERSVEPSTGI